jgi:hypothetical protein
MFHNVFIAQNMVFQHTFLGNNEEIKLLCHENINAGNVSNDLIFLISLVQASNMQDSFLMGICFQSLPFVRLVSFGGNQTQFFQNGRFCYSNFYFLLSNFQPSVQYTVQKFAIWGRENHD